MHEENARDAVCIDPCKIASLSFSKDEDPEQKKCVEEYDKGTSGESPFLSNGAEDEISFLLRDKTICGHRALKESFSRPTTAAHGCLGVSDVIIGIGVSNVHSKQHVDAFFLMCFENAFESAVHPCAEDQCRRKTYDRGAAHTFPVSGDYPTRNQFPEDSTQGEQDHPQPPDGRLGSKKRIIIR